MELFAWVGEDEYGSGTIGLKQGLVPAGMIPLVATTEAKVSQKYIRDQLCSQAAAHGKRIYLVRFVAAEILDYTPEGEPGACLTT